MTIQVRLASAAVLACGLVALCLAAAAQAQATVTAGQKLAQACAVCHGAIGLAVAPDAPNLAGQPAVYLTAQLRAYRSGTRKHEVMAVIARPLSDDDIAQLAAWFASIEISAKAPP